MILHLSSLVKRRVYIRRVVLHTATVFTVHASDPAARAAFAFEQLGHETVDMLRPGFGLFVRNNPADPFVPRERGQVLPTL